VVTSQWCRRRGTGRGRQILTHHAVFIEEDRDSLQEGRAGPGRHRGAMEMPWQWSSPPSPPARHVLLHRLLVASRHRSGLLPEDLTSSSHSSTVFVRPRHHQQPSASMAVASSRARHPRSLRPGSECFSIFLLGYFVQNSWLVLILFLLTGVLCKCK
jgi:hypothetical protein